MTTDLNTTYIRLCVLLTAKKFSEVFELLKSHSKNLGIVIDSYLPLFEMLESNNYKKTTAFNSFLNIDSAVRDNRENYWNKLISSMYYYLEDKKSAKKTRVVKPSNKLIIPESKELTVLFKSTKADYGLNAQLEFEYSRQTPKLAKQHAKNIISIALNKATEIVILIGEGATRIIRSPYPEVSHALKVLCLLKTVIVDGVTYRGLKGAIQLELMALSMTVNTRAKAMLKGAISPRMATIEKNGMEWCITQSLARLPESLRLWSMENGTFDGVELATLFRLIIGTPKVPLPYDKIMKKINYAERKINEELEKYGIPKKEITNKEFLADFLNSGDWETEINERKCVSCKRIIQKNWVRCPFES